LGSNSFIEHLSKQNCNANKENNNENITENKTKSRKILGFKKLIKE